jgi:hypothetical protein
VLRDLWFACSEQLQWNTEERIARLERHNRLLIAGLSLVLASFLVAAAITDAVPEVVKARAFHVVGKDRTALAKLEDTFGVSLPAGLLLEDHLAERRGPG